MINGIFGFNNPGIDYMIMESDTSMHSAVDRFERAAAAGALPTDQCSFDDLLGIDYDRLTESDKKELIKRVEKIYRSNGYDAQFNR